jgi:hypothetical protein
MPKKFNKDLAQEAKYAMKALLPLMKIVDRFIDLCNSRAKSLEFSNKQKVFRPINYQDNDALDGIEDLSKFVEYQNDKIKIDPALKVGENFLSFTTQTNIHRVCYGLTELVRYRTEIRRRGSSFYLRSMTTDYAEQLFSYIASECGGNCNVLNFVRTVVKRNDQKHLKFSNYEQLNCKKEKSFKKNKNKLSIVKENHNRGNDDNYDDDDNDNGNDNNENDNNAKNEISQKIIFKKTNQPKKCAKTFLTK